MSYQLVSVPRRTHFCCNIPHRPVPAAPSDQNCRVTDKKKKPTSALLWARQAAASVQRFQKAAGCLFAWRNSVMIGVFDL